MKKVLILPIIFCSLQVFGQTPIVKKISQDVCICLAQGNNQLATCMTLSIVQFQNEVALAYGLSSKSTYEESKQVGVILRKEVEADLKKTCNKYK